jgi:hypothetical protein
MAEGTFLSWEEMQRLALPPNTAMLIPPLPEPEEVACLAAGPPHAHPDWLDDGLYTESSPTSTATRQLQDDNSDPAPGDGVPGPVRLIANLITVNALLEYAYGPHKKPDDEEADRQRRQLKDSEPAA